MVKIAFISVKGTSVTLDISGKFNPDTVSAQLCKELNLEKQKFLFYQNNFVISKEIPIDEIVKAQCPIVYRKTPTSHSRPKAQITSGIQDLHNAVEQSLMNTTTSKPRIYNSYENVIAHEKKRSAKDPDNMDDMVKKLMEAGFAKDSVIRALRKNDYNPEQAVDYLLNGESNDIQIPALLRLLFNEEQIQRITMIFKREDLPRPNTPYYRHFNEESFTQSDTNYTPANERNAREDVQRIQRRIQDDINNFNQAQADYNNGLRNSNSETEKRRIAENIHNNEIKHEKNQERLQQDLQRAQNRLEQILVSKREAGIEDERPPPLRRPRVNPELQPTLNSLTDDEVRQLMDIRGQFDEILQMYVILDKNIDSVRAAME